MMDDINISGATSTSQISSLALGHHRLSSSAASIPSSSSSASSFRGVPDDHWTRQLIFPPFPGHRPPAISHPTAAADVNTAAAPPALDPGSLLHGGAKITTDFEHYDYESEEGGEISEEQKRPPPRSGSKRSRAAEVHNLSEKRRRSRINEKMKALQNLIPNSNKTDKASMLDEAIEYLKQLQLQVQMLSMRNGLNLQTMYLPGTMPALQSSHIGMGLNPDDGSLINMAVGMMPSSHDSSVHHSPFEISKQMMSNVPAISNPVTSLGIESSQFNSFPFPLPGEAILEPSRLVDGEDDGGSTSGAFPGGNQQSQGGIHAGKQQWKV